MGTLILDDLLSSNPYQGNCGECGLPNSVHIAAQNGEKFVYAMSEEGLERITHKEAVRRSREKNGLCSAKR